MKMTDKLKWFEKWQLEFISTDNNLLLQDSFKGAFKKGDS